MSNSQQEHAYEIAEPAYLKGRIRTATRMLLLILLLFGSAGGAAGRSGAKPIPAVPLPIEPAGLNGGLSRSASAGRCFAGFTFLCLHPTAGACLQPQMGRGKLHLCKHQYLSDAAKKTKCQKVGTGRRAPKRDPLSLSEALALPIHAPTGRGPGEGLKASDISPTCRAAIVLMRGRCVLDTACIPSTRCLLAGEWSLVRRRCPIQNAAVRAHALRSPAWCCSSRRRDARPRWPHCVRLRYHDIYVINTRLY